MTEPAPVDSAGGAEPVAVPVSSSVRVGAPVVSLARWEWEWVPETGPVSAGEPLTVEVGASTLPGTEAVSPPVGVG